MFILGNFFLALAQVLDILLTILYWLILVRALVSWVNPDPYNPIVQILTQTTEPILEPIRRFLPMMGMDISPLIAFVLIVGSKMFLVQTLFDIGSRLKY